MNAEMTLDEEEEAKFRESVAYLASDAFEQDELPLQWSNYAAQRLLATLDAARDDHRRWVDATYGRDGADSVLLYKSTHAKLEAAWYALVTVAQWDEVAQQKVAEIQATDDPTPILQEQPR